MPSSPRPILKDPASTPCEAARGVHFPPTPSLSRTYSAHPPSEYDRTPIVVTANTCALPERGGRTITDDDAPPTPTPACKRRLVGDVHPRALGPCSTSSLPQLIPDMTTSESEESDGLTSPPEFQNAIAARELPSLDLAAALAFLPHPTKSAATEAATPQVIPARPTRPRRSRIGTSSSRPALRIDINRLGAEEEEDDDDDAETVVSYSPTLRCTMPNRRKLARLKDKLGNASFDLTPSEECLGWF